MIEEGKEESSEEGNTPSSSLDCKEEAMQGVRKAIQGVRKAMRKAIQGVRKAMRKAIQE